jgi:hypothetical protein
VRGVLIVDGELKLVTLKSDTDIGDCVGGYIERAIAIGLPERGRSLDVWCNEEGRLNGMTPNVWVMHDSLYAPLLLYGPVLVLAGNVRTGDTVSLTHADMDRITLVKWEGSPFPVLMFKDA